MARPHQKLDVWQQSMRLVRMTYAATQGFPKEEQYGLTAQVRRAAVSIPSNLAEGSARNSKKEMAQFVGIAKGSLSELETQMLIATDLGYLPVQHEVFAQLERVAQLLSGLYRSIAR
jgi:four helix bundle protein